MIEDKINNKIIAGGIILGISLAIAICTYSFWSYFRSFEIFGKTLKTFYLGISLSFVGYTIAINLIIKYLYNLYKFNNKKLLIILIISECAVIASSNNLLDEIAFDPTKLGINEYIGILIMFLITTIRLIKNGNRKKRI